MEGLAIPMKLRDLVYRLYARRVEYRLDTDQVPKHIGVILDGNRRWARASGGTTEQGHQAGAEKIQELLGWCAETDVEVVTLWLLSTDNLHRADHELLPLLGIIEDTVRDLAGTAAGASTTSAARPAPGPYAAGAEEGRAAGGRDRRNTGQRRRRVRRPPGDHRRRALAARRPRRRRRDAGGARGGSSTSSTSPSTSTPGGSPTRTWSSAPAASSGCPASCSGRALTPSTTSARSSGPPSARSTSCAPCVTTPRGTAATGTESPLPGAGAPALRAPRARPALPAHTRTQRPRPPRSALGPGPGPIRHRSLSDRVVVLTRPGSAAYAIACLSSAGGISASWLGPSTGPGAGRPDCRPRTTAEGFAATRMSRRAGARPAPRGSGPVSSLATPSHPDLFRGGSSTRGDQQEAQ